MELLCFSDNMKALEPATLVTEIKTAHQKAYNEY